MTNFKPNSKLKSWFFNLIRTNKSKSMQPNKVSRALNYNTVSSEVVDVHN